MDANNCTISLLCIQFKKHWLKIIRKIIKSIKYDIQEYEIHFVINAKTPFYRKNSKSQYMKCTLIQVLNPIEGRKRSIYV